MKLKKNNSKQKLRGAYYTPSQLAKQMIKLVISDNITNVLEPSCGDGIFIDSLKELNLLNKLEKITAIEIDEVETTKVKNNYFTDSNVCVHNEDFFDFYKYTYGNEKFDLILGNPPYSLSVSY